MIVSAPADLDLKCSWISNLTQQVFLIRSRDANIGLYACGMQISLDCCKVHRREEHNLLRFSMVVDGIKESRTRMGYTDTLLLLRKGSV